MATTPNRSWPTPDDTDLVRDGASAIRALGDAIDGTVGQGFVYAGTRYYTSSGQFEKADPLGTGDIGLRAIKVTVTGGGGSGGRVAGSRTGAGGGSGATAVKFSSDIAGLASSVDVTVGAGGTAITNNFTDGVDGGNSIFDVSPQVVGTGGPGTVGVGVVSVGGVAATGGDLNISGGSGGAGNGVTFTNAPQSAGDGGASFWGGGGGGGSVSTSAKAGVAFGSGGGGAYGSDHGSGAGAAGVVAIDCFV